MILTQNYDYVLTATQENLLKSPDFDCHKGL